MDEKVLDYITIYAPAAIAILSAINALTKHYTKFNGILKIIMELIERLSVLSSKNTRGRFKMPGTSVSPDVDIERLEHYRNVKKQLEAVAKRKETNRHPLSGRRR
jgi:hypothetical protein